MISEIWLIEGGRPVLGAYNDARPSSLTQTGEHLVPLASVAHRGELSELYSRARATRRNGVASYLWIDVVNPTAFELAMLADVLSLPKLQVEDALTTRQRPKLERNDDRVFLVMRAVNYLEATSDIESHQVSAFAAPGYLVTIAQSDHHLADDMQARLAAEPSLRRSGSSAGIYALLDVVVDGFVAAAAGIGEDIGQLEEAVFSPDLTADTEDIYRLKRENLELRRAVTPFLPQAAMLARGTMDLIDDSMQPYFADVADHMIRVADSTESSDQLLMTLLMAVASLQGVRQNNDMRRISAYAAMGVVPTLIAGIYGMNFEGMPELDEPWGYPFALGLMAGIVLLLHRAFKKSGWL